MMIAKKKKKKHDKNKSCGKITKSNRKMAFVGMNDYTRSLSRKEEAADVINKVDDANTFDGDSNALFEAVRFGRSDVVRGLLRQRRADPTRTNAKGRSVLHVIAEERNKDVEFDDDEAVRMASDCLDKVAWTRRLCFLNARTTTAGWTPLMAASDKGRVLLVEWLLKKGAGVNAAMATGWTAAHSAAKNGHVDVLKLLLAKGADSDLEASHKEFGRNCKLDDVSIEDEILEVLKDNRIKPTHCC